MMPERGFAKVHFVGIGGSGMSSIAEVLLRQGHAVSGSDRVPSQALERLRGLGARVSVGHSAESVGEVDVVVFSSAVPADNMELQAARSKGIPVLKRSALLGEMTRGRRSLAVAGTHGKTTTTMMTGEIWRRAGARPTVIAGGTSRGGSTSSGDGEGILVVEADEYDRAFLDLHPDAALVNNIDSDHLEYYGGMEALRQAFAAFLERLPEKGRAYLNMGDPGAASLRAGCNRAVVGFAASSPADYRAVGVRLGPDGSRFDLEIRGRSAGGIRLRVPGLHNVVNALGAAALSLEEGVSLESAAAALEDFQGAHRRFEPVGEKGGVRLYDDYAHHPTEVRAAIEAARQLRPGRVVAVFQPHLYSRTRSLGREFAAALTGADVVFVTPVYAAREAPLPGVEGDLIADAVRAAGGTGRFVEDMSRLAGAVARDLRAGDLVLLMGAGDINEYGRRILEEAG